MTTMSSRVREPIPRHRAKAQVRKLDSGRKTPRALGSRTAGHNPPSSPGASVANGGQAAQRRGPTPTNEACVRRNQLANVAALETP